MLIEIHVIQNHSPANLNRDDLGAPKTCIFGGVTRARISSQCLKRSIRRSPKFAAALETGGAKRTRRLVHDIARRVHDGPEVPEDLKKRIQKVFKDGGVGFNVKGDPFTSDILWFIPESAIEEMAEAARRNADDLGQRFADIIGKFVKTPDIALCGRMTEFEAKGPFQGLKGKFTVEAALSASHAISTHAVVNEVDYFTAADDIPGPDAGAAHVNEAVFNSACFYKHFCIDWAQLLENLGGDADLAALTVKCFLEGATRAKPSGKQHAYAAFNLPDGVLVEVKADAAEPVNYANAFADPVSQSSPRGLIGESIACLGQYVHEIAAGYGIEAERFWFSPSDRHALTYVDRNEKSDAKKEKPVLDADHCIEEFGRFVGSVMDAVTRAQAAEAPA